MKMSRDRTALEGGSITQHRPQNIDPPTRQRDESLSVPLAFSSLALVEDSGLRSASQAGKGRLVEDPLEGLVPSSHPAVLTHTLAGVVGGGYQTGVGGQPIGAREGADVAYGDQELGPEDRSHTRQANEN